MADRRQVRADLVEAAGARLDGEHRRPGAPFLDAPCRARRTTARIDVRARPARVVSGSSMTPASDAGAPSTSAT
jgi:hypothetical protein